MPRSLAGRRRARRRRGDPARTRRNARPRARSHTTGTHGSVSVRVFQGFGGDHGGRPVPHSVHRHQGPGVRRRPCGQFRAVPLPRTPPRLRHQRLRRNRPGSVGMGREAPGRQRRNLRTRTRLFRKGAQSGDARSREMLPGSHARFRAHGIDGRMVRPHGRRKPL